MNSADVIIIGGGIVGLATAHILADRYPDKRIIVLEKEPQLAFHQTGHNSGVLHSGIYYKPGSLKAATCRTGKRAMQEFCEREGIRYEICGKVIVAVDASERERLRALYERGRANSIHCRLIGREQLAELEPHAAGIEAIHVPETGIVDYRQVAEALAARLKERGNQIITGARVTRLKETSSEVVVSSASGDFTARLAVNCAGLYSDRVTAMGGSRPQARIVPFRGEYYKLKAEAEHLCKNLIYPVSDPQFPFLGVHFTRQTSGAVECGPNAVLAFAREGYTKGNVNFRDLFETLTYPGFLRMARKHWRMGAGEMWRSLNKRAFVRALRRLVPEITEERLVAAPAGVRAQAVALDGAMVDDFSFDERPRVVNVINAPSPAATASLSIGKVVVERLAKHF